MARSRSDRAKADTARVGDVVELVNGSVVMLTGWVNGGWLVQRCDPVTLRLDEAWHPSSLDVPVKRVLHKVPRGKEQSKEPGDYDPVKGEG